MLPAPCFCTRSAATASKKAGICWQPSYSATASPSCVSTSAATATASSSSPASGSNRHIDRLRTLRSDNIISFRDFTPAYYPLLANDIAAARLFLDRMNDAGECNSANLLIIGAEDGAALAALWLASEWHRHRILDVRWVDPAPQGKDVMGAVWLSITPGLGTDPNLGSKQTPVVNWLAEAGRDHNVPMVFFYGEADTAAANFAHRCLKELKAGSTTNLTSDVSVANAGKLAGQQLLDKGLMVRSHDKDAPAPTWIVEYASQLRRERSWANWDRREPDKADWLWKFPGRDVPGKGLLPVEMMGER